MKAADIKIGNHYVSNTSTLDVFDKSNWRNNDRVEVIEAGVPGFKLKYGWASYRTTEVDTGGRKDHALVRRFVRDHDAERKIQFDKFDRKADVLKASPGWSDLSDEEMSAQLKTAMDACTPDAIWKKGPEDRVPLRSIRMEWVTYARKTEQREASQKSLEANNRHLDKRLEAVSNKLPGTLRIKRTWAGHNKATHLVISGGSKEDIVSALEKLV